LDVRTVHRSLLLSALVTLSLALPAAAVAGPVSVEEDVVSNAGTLLLSTDTAGDVYIPKSSAVEIRDPDGVGHTVGLPVGLAMRVVPGASGDLYVATYNSLVATDRTGAQRWSANGYGLDVAMAGTGLWATSSADDQLRRVDPATGAQLGAGIPTGLTVPEIEPRPGGGVLAHWGSALRPFAGDGSALAARDVPGAMAAAELPGGDLIVALRVGGRVVLRRIAPDGGTVAQLDDDLLQSSYANGDTGAVSSIAVGSGGTLWVGLMKDYMNARVLRVQRRPVVQVTAAATRVLTGAPVAVGAQVAGAPLDPVADYAWDLDGDQIFEHDSGTVPTATATFATPGPKTVYVRVTTRDGQVATFGVGLDVRPAPPAGIPGVSIDAGARFTNDPHVTVAAVWPPFAVGMAISNDGGFAGAVTRPVGASTAWTLDSSGPERLPKTIYVRFNTGAETDPIWGPETYQDDVILDETAPLLRSAQVVGRSLKLSATDELSGVAQVQLAARSTANPAAAVTYASTVRVAAAPKYARVFDTAGNASAWRRVAPAATATLPASIARATLARRGLRVAVTCAATCRAAVTVRDGGRRVASATRTVRRRGTVTLRVARLRATARRLTVRVVLKAAGGAAGTTIARSLRVR
jgi:hypothetical protein